MRSVFPRGRESVLRHPTFDVARRPFIVIWEVTRACDLALQTSCFPLNARGTAMGFRKRQRDGVRSLPEQRMRIRLRSREEAAEHRQDTGGAAPDGPWAGGRMVARGPARVGDDDHHGRGRAGGPALLLRASGVVWRR